MAFGPGSMSTDGVLQKIVLWVGSIAILAIGGWVANSISGLQTEVMLVKLALTKIEQKVDRLPSPELIIRLDEHEKRMSEIEARLTIMATRLHQKLGVEPPE